MHPTISIIHILYNYNSYIQLKIHQSSGSGRTRSAMSGTTCFPVLPLVMNMLFYLLLLINDDEF